MSQAPPQTLDEIVENLKRQLSAHSAGERQRVTAAADAAINRIHELEASLGQPPQTVGSAAIRRRSPRRFERGLEPDPAKDVPAGALLMARRLADEGHTRGEVTEFLAENFRRIDVPAAVDHAFLDAPTRS